MKILFFISLLVVNNLYSYGQSVAINNDGSLPNASSMLDIKSSAKGLLIPRMSSQQRVNIQTPVKGLMVFDNDTNSFWFYNGAGWVQVAGSGGAGYWALNGNNIYKTNGGNVGVGTNTPAFPLTIKTPINSTGWTHIGGADSIILSEGIGGVSAAIGTSSNHAFRLNAGGQGRISIYPTGQVVIGDNSVGAIGMLTVKTLNNSDGISHIGEGGNVLKTIMGGTSAGIGTFSHTNMRIFSGGNSCILIAEATGYVGIGTDNPTYKLSVNGTIRSKEIIVEAAPWPDYVFDEHYKLTDINQLESYIEQNRHLPNISSAADVAANGIALGDTQKKMMEKIEELTLYIIDINKKLALLEQQLGDKTGGSH